MAEVLARKSSLEILKKSVRLKRNDIRQDLNPHEEIKWTGIGNYIGNVDVLCPFIFSTHLHNNYNSILIVEF